MDPGTLTLAIISTLAITCSLSLWQRLKYQSSQQETETRHNNESQAALSKTKAERRELRLLLNASDDSLIITDPKGVVQVANESTRTITIVKTLRGRQIDTIIRNGKISQNIKELMQNSVPETRTIILNNSNLDDKQTLEKSAWLIDYAPISANTAATTGENIPHHRFILRDITKEHRTDQIKREFVANASHELRTPLAIISGYLENLIDDDDLDDPATSRNMLTTMRKQSERLERLIEEMLTISKLESGEIAVLNQESFQLKQAIETVIDRLAPMTHKQNSEITTLYSDDNIQLIGDRFYWEQALFNIIENALKQNTQTALSIKISADINLAKKQLEINISDNGKGIPPADLPYIFNRFFRVQKDHSQNEVKGTGLGLSIVKHVIESHGGSVSAASSPGIETTFSITLPNNS